MTLSLNTRLLLAGSVVLAAFLGVTGMVLDRAYLESAEQALKERLQAHVVGLVAAAQLREDGRLVMPPALPEGRYHTSGSGLLAQATSNDGLQIWRSPSMQGLDIQLIRGLASGVRKFEVIRSPTSGAGFYAVGLGVTWDLSEDVKEGVTFSVAENLSILEEQVARFRNSLWGWLGGVALVLLAVQGMVLRWSLAPLRGAAEDLAAIEAGRQTLLVGPYPQELHGLTDNINALLISQREHLERYRRTLGDLAHSLKTPLAVLRGSLSERSGKALRHIVAEQVERMSEIVDYQLQKAATSGHQPLAAPVAVASIAEKVKSSLNKVYGDKQVDCRLSIAPDTDFHGDEGDLMEVLGNLMDNAYKYCHSRVTVTLAPVSISNGLQITVEDDGSGIPPDRIETVLTRGVRVNTTPTGHGIGLAIVQDIVQVYRGELFLGASERLGGAKVTLSLPN
ncbi:MAG TPA: GHKL domain-containing protein [Gammaproteobacteria bacterium]|nr:GHKL domain-containing protein [Gammaproteobacteria bacterium]